MKTTVLFRMIVLVAMVFAGISNATVKAQNNNFITNEETVGDLVVSKVIYRLDGSLYRHMKYDFTYDDQKRMATKEAFKSLWYTHVGMTLTELTTHLLKRVFMN